MPVTTPPKRRGGSKPANGLVSLRAAEKAVGETAWLWPGRCAEIAHKVRVGCKLPGRDAYGHWAGPISPKSTFAERAGLGFTQHGWCILPDGRVMDPTRWVFEGKRPYIYVGPADHYDEGGNALRARLVGEAPTFDPDEERVEFKPHDLPSAPWTFIEELLGLTRRYHGPEPPEPGVVTQEQAMWLARVPPLLLGDHAKAIYQALEKKGLKAWVPLDNWRRIVTFGEAPQERVRVRA